MFAVPPYFITFFKTNVFFITQVFYYASSLELARYLQLLNSRLLTAHDNHSL